ncbi:hypothetical protein GP486_007276 [Trichoglossum hirsutum]|uniref:Uncharacterized protein n=1 Tax=Trichoglossum hirsutum TaxID=265104 RepID=A0A9P8IC27_9PEZI|nr:hypothetical protein GP486_007276 [Trichoglossum hirsutum]
MAMQGARPANDEEVQEALRRIGRTPPEDDNEETTCRPAAYGPPTVKQETLCQKADDEDEEAPGLTEAEFYERLQDPKALYQELAELIQRTRDLKAFSENYLENKLRGNADAYPTEDLKIIYVAGRVSGDALALISPRLWVTNWHAYETAFKDLIMRKEQTFQEFYSTFLRCVADRNISPRDLKDDLNDKLTWKLQEAVATYYNDSTITLSQFAKHCTTNDQQIQARLEKHDRTTRKPDGTRKAAMEQVAARRTSKTTEGEKAT